ncbi:right-handed parallel beta-helix repeat-containing protein [Phycisphaeraceae bacterium D3-23]
MMFANMFVSDRPRTRWAGPIVLLCCAVLMALAAGPARASIVYVSGISGIDDGQRVTGELNLQTHVIGRADMTLYELSGPISRYYARTGPTPALSVDALTGKAIPWDISTFPEGDYQLRVTAVLKDGADHSATVRFSIRHDLTNTEQNSILIDVDETLPPAQDGGESGAQVPQVVVVGGSSSDSGPVSVLGNLEAASELPAVHFRDQPDNYTRGSGGVLRVGIGGPMPAGGDIIVIAWSKTEARIIDEFAHALDLDDPAIRADRLDLLPAGETQIQLLVRQASQIHQIVRMNLDIVVRDTPESALPEVGFVDPPSTYERGSGEAIRVSLAQSMPEGGDILALAWSKEEQRMVEAFAFIVGDDLLIPAQALDVLPAGGIQLQLLARLNNELQQRVTHALQLNEAVVPEPPTVVPLPGVGFVAPPSTYHHASGEDVAVSVVGPMPSNADIVVVAWSDSQQGMVSDFAFTMDSGDWRIPAEQMELLPLGRVEVQLLLRRDNEVHSVTAHQMEIAPPTPVVLPTPDPDFRPVVSFGQTPTQHAIGSGQGIDIQSTGAFPEGTDLLVIAWSVDLGQLVDAFAFTLSDGPLEITAAQMDLLPAGDVILQLMPRADNSAYAQVTHRINIVQPGSSGGGEVDVLPNSGEPGNTTDPMPDDGPDSSPDGNPDGNPDETIDGSDAEPGDGGDGEGPKPDAVEVTFASGTANTHLRGANAPLALSFSGPLPSGSSIRVQAWSTDLDRYVSLFTQTLDEGPWEIASTQLDLLADGSYRIDVALFVPGEPAAHVQHHLIVSSPNAGDQDASPESPAAGFTAYTRSDDTRVIYVSADGDDANNGLAPGTAVRTLERGAELVRDGRPDWMLVRRGDVFDLPVDENGPFRYWDKGGRSYDEPMIVGAYGDANAPRPRINSNGRGVLRSISESHLVFRDLHFTANFRDPHGPEFDGGDEMETGISVSATTDLRFEACLVEYFSMNIMFRDGSNSVDPTLRGIMLHRCTIRNAYAHGETDSSGLYLKLADGVTINECLFDHNGWDEDVPESVRRGRNHNIYFSNCKNITVHGNIIARESYLALKIRCEVEGLTRNVEVTDNLFLECAYPMDMGANGPKDQINFVNVTIRGNVCVRTTGWPLDAPRGTGMKITRVAHARVSQNLFVDNGPNGPDKNEAFRVDGESDLEDIMVYDNDGILPLLEGEELFSTHYRQREDHDDIEFQNNRENVADSRYVDADRSIEVYLQGIGSSSIDDFLQRATRQDSVNWDTALMADSVSSYYREGFTLTLFD